MPADDPDMVRSDVVYSPAVMRFLTGTGSRARHEQSSQPAVFRTDWAHKAGKTVSSSYQHLSDCELSHCCSRLSAV